MFETQSMRIRYRERDDGLLESVRNWKSSKTEFSVILDKTANSWQIVDTTTGSVVKEGSNETSKTLKLAARKALQTLGVTLNTEQKCDYKPRIAS